MTRTSKSAIQPGFDDLEGAATVGDGGARPREERSGAGHHPPLAPDPPQHEAVLAESLKTDHSSDQLGDPVLVPSDIQRGDSVAEGRSSGLPEAATAHRNGIDVSNNQGNVNWSAVRSSGVTFAIAKATEGTGFTDQFIDQNIAGMKRAGIVPGAYHFAHPGSDATAQANHFTDVVRRANGGSFSGMLHLALDLEVTDGRSPSQVWAWTQTFVNRVRAVTGHPCIIYTGFYFWRDSVGDPNNNLDCPLWLAAYVPESQTGGLTPRAWSGVGWAFWQYTGSGSVPGVAGNVDRDYFRNGGSYLNINSLRIP